MPQSMAHAQSNEEEVEISAEKNSVFNTQIAYIHNKTNTTVGYSVGLGSGGASFGISISSSTNATLYAAQPLTIFT